MTHKQQVTWKEIHQHCHSISDTYHPQVIVPILRGGLAIGLILSHQWTCELIPFRYQTIDSHAINYPDELNQHQHSSILVVDDIYDSGQTFQGVNQLLMNRGFSQVQYWSVYRRYPKQDKYQYGQGIETDAWLEFPWEI